MEHNRQTVEDLVLETVSRMEGFSEDEAMGAAVAMMVLLDLTDDQLAQVIACLIPLKAALEAETD